MGSKRAFFGNKPAVIYIADNISLAAWNSSDTSSGLWSGMQGLCEPLGCDLLVITGDKRISGFISAAHDLVAPDSADGFLAWRTRTGPDCTAYFQSLAQVPLVFLSTAHGTQAAVAISNREGILALVQHLVEVHGCRKIGYIGGPAGHRYAQERFAAYSEALQSHGISPDPAWVAPPGPWLLTTGEAGARVLLRERGLQPGKDLDAIVCASDQLALGAMAELARCGAHVPQQIAITGFNNIREARTHFPSLTTAAMPFQQQGRQALLQLLAEMHLMPPLEDGSHLVPRLVVGESCGCGNQRLVNWHVGDDRIAGESSAGVVDLQELICQHLYQIRLWSEANDLACQVVAALRQVAKTGELDPALRLILPLIRTGYFGLLDQVFWQQVFGAVRQCLANWCPDPQDFSRAECALESLRETVAEHYSREQGALTVWENKVFDLLRILSADLALVDDLPAMMKRLAQDFPPLGINACWLVLYDALPKGGHVPESAHLVLAVEQCHHRDLPPEGVAFPTRQLIPEGYRQSPEAGVFTLFPIMHGESEYGYVIFNESASTNYYETLANALGSAMRHLRLRNELEMRTHQLERSYQDLIGAQKRLVEADKMAALGELVAGMAHEINTPVGVGVTAISTLMDGTHALADLVQRRQAGPIPGVVQNLQESAAIAMRNLERAAQLIESFKLIAVDQTRGASRTFNLEHYLADVVRSVQARLKPGGHQVAVTCASDIEITCDPSIVARVITNLLINSLLHGFEGRRDGRISIQAHREGGQVLLVYRDDGCGMDAATLEKMFHPFFTTKRGRGGTGLGMHIVYNLVTQGLGGTILCESSPGQGVCFRIDFPV